VFDDSPAAKAGLKVNDIILRAAEHDVKSPENLVVAVNEAKENELLLVVLRGGSETQVKVTPTRRPEGGVQLSVSPDARYADVITSLEELARHGPAGDVRLFAVRPGGVFALETAKFPKNLEVIIEKRGDNPAKIRVKRSGDGEEKTWEVTEDKLNELPEDVRVHVKQLLGGQLLAMPKAMSLRVEGAHKLAEEIRAKAEEAQRNLEHTLKSFRVEVKPLPPGAAPIPGVPVVPPVPGVPGVPAGARVPAVIAGQRAESIEQKLEEIIKKLDRDSVIERLEQQVKELRKEVEALRQEKK
jgi:membrane-associated protease RseP (regulator of RpoE activity)